VQRFAPGERHRAGVGGGGWNLYVLSFGFGLITASILAIASVWLPTLQFGVTNVLNLAYGDVTDRLGVRRLTW